MKVEEREKIKQNYKDNIKTVLNELKKKTNKIVNTACSEDSHCCGVDISITIQPGFLVTYEIKYSHYALGEQK